MESSIFWDITPCSPLSFDVVCSAVTGYAVKHSHAIPKHTLKVEAAGPSETLQSIYQITRCRISEGPICHTIVPLEFIPCIISCDGLRIVYCVGPTVAICYVKGV
jgi:hypothetical protein